MNISISTMGGIYTAYSDKQLLTFLSENNEAAFTEIFERYRERLFFYIKKHTKSSEIAEEIVTDIFMKLWVGRDLTAKIEDLAGFLHKVAYYKAMDFLRVTVRHARLQQVYVTHAFNSKPEKSVHDIMIDAEDREILYKAINKLPPQRQTIYRLSREEGLTHEKIAEILNLSRSTINNQLVSAVRSIELYIRKKRGLHTLYFFFIYI
ncbi:MAG: sigma-70 family RNA polymerase sigma factor [Arachidicoccus sp.]|nr:sigma-70 family RNA polymerase sigma factor [Arachidicoccus sp.]